MFRTLLSLILLFVCLNPAQADEPVQLNPAPAIQPETSPMNPVPGHGSPLSVDSHANTADYMQYEPYNIFPREVDLWNLEGQKLVRSEPVVSPDKSVFAYSETLFMPNTRQTMGRLYLVPVPPPPPKPVERLPSEQVLQPAPPPPMEAKAYQDRFDPNRTTSIRQSIAAVGYNKVNPFEFRTLSITDWSVSGRRLLFKQRSGVLHVGLRTSDILVYDQAKGTVTIYPEVHRVIQHYWTTHGNLSHLNELSWDIQPIGWSPNSDNEVLLKAWALDKNAKKFLGLWQYDVDAERTRLLSLDDIPAPVAANGWLAHPVEVSPEPNPKQHWWKLKKSKP